MTDPEIGHAECLEDLSTPLDDPQVEPGARPWVEEQDVQSPDHPELAFVQAKGYTPGRPDGKPLWIVIHDMEASETATRAETTAVYFADPPDDRNVSSHYTVDNNSIVQCVRLRDSAWTVGNRPGNNRGINWELSGFASQTREQWLDSFGQAMFVLMVPIVQADAAKYGIPLQRRTVAELKAWKPGITSHNDLRLAFGGTTHTDPGANFPWDHLMAALLAGDDMAITCSFGETGDARSNVACLQERLRRLGHTLAAGEVGNTRVYGATTAAALKTALATVAWNVDGKAFWAGEVAALGEVEARRWAGKDGQDGADGAPGPPGVGFAPGQTVTITGTATVAE